MFTVTGCGERIDVVPRRRRSYVPVRKTRKRKRDSDYDLDSKQALEPSTTLIKGERNFFVRRDDIKQMNKNSLAALSSISSKETPVKKSHDWLYRREVQADQNIAPMYSLPPLSTPNLKRRESLMVQNPTKPFGCGYSPRPNKPKNVRAKKIWEAAVRQSISGRTPSPLSKYSLVRQTRKNNRSLSILCITKSGVGKRRSSMPAKVMLPKKPVESFLTKRMRSLANFDGRVSTMVNDLSKCSLLSSHLRRRSIALHELEPLRQKLWF